MNENKKKALEATLNVIQKKFGKGSIMRLGDKRALQVEVIPTGIVNLDFALGVGGIPRGRVIEIFGPESSGKTTLMLNLVAEVQKRGGIAAFIDAEHALDPEYAKTLGVNVEDLIISQPDTGEDALEIAEMLVRSGSVDFIVVDSVAALVPKAELEGNMGDAHVGLQARLMSQALRKLTAVVSKTKVPIVFINQIREKVGVFFGNPETTPGGRALKFFSSVRMEIRKISPIKSGSEIIGDRIRVKIVKNKVAPPFKTAEFDLIHGKGIDKLGSLLDAAVEFAIVKKAGSWFAFNEVKLGQGRDNAISFLRENPDLIKNIRELLLKKFEELYGRKPILFGHKENELKQEGEKK